MNTFLIMLVMASVWAASMTEFTEEERRLIAGTALFAGIVLWVMIEAGLIRP